MFKTPFEDSTEDPVMPAHYINRAIAMHLLRGGQFAVANTFIKEAHEQYAQGQDQLPAGPDDSLERDWEDSSRSLQKNFGEMYRILDELQLKHNLEPAIEWARTHSSMLQTKGSDLEFHLCRLKYVSLFLGTDGVPVSAKQEDDGDAMAGAEDHQEGMPPEQEEAAEAATERLLRAADYARRAFLRFQARYGPEIQKLSGALAYWQNIPASPYAALFAGEDAWVDVASSFTKEFCSFLGLSAESPLYIAATAGFIAQPVLLKVRKLMESKRTEWTTTTELPVEIPLPPSFSFHSIFVCPVSKEQATDDNPPMILPCGHVLCSDSLKNASRGIRFKCPYCPVESHPKDAKKVYL
jgi:hypothetical protein